MPLTPEEREEREAARARIMADCEMILDALQSQILEGRRRARGAARRAATLYRRVSGSRMLLDRLDEWLEQSKADPE